MDPQMFVNGVSEAAVPAPMWFVQFFKALGFTLHMVPMNLWFAGLLIALFLHVWGNSHARRFAGRLLQQMPIIIAVGINFGIVPLLFVQVAYAKFFYPATILMAWFWLGIVILLIPAYYGVYAYAWAIHDGAKEIAFWKKAAGWLAAIFFVAIGFLFANGFSLTEHVARWPELWKAHSTAGAALGTATNIGDPTLWPRLFMMFGLALGTTAVWAVVDAEWLTGKTVDEAYRRWAWGFARKLYSAAICWTAAAGAWYVFGTWSPELRARMFLFGAQFLPLLTIATAIAPGLPWLLLTISHRYASPRMAALLALAQFGVLGINAVSRQVVQNINVKPYFDVLAQPTDVQWGPLFMFLIVFVLALAIVAWMLLQVAKCKPKAG